MAKKTQILGFLGLSDSRESEKTISHVYRKEHLRNILLVWVFRTLFSFSLFLISQSLPSVLRVHFDFDLLFWQS